MTTLPHATPDESTGLPSPAELLDLFHGKYRASGGLGPGPRSRLAAGYHPPADVYEALVRRVVAPGTRWLDVGGGRSIFPENPGLARELVARCGRVTAVDPSDNVLGNPFVTDRHHGPLESFTPREPYDLATMRMVLEHVAEPNAFLSALSRALRPGGRVFALTVNLYAPLTLASRVTPFALHHPIKRVLWGGDERDTFPTAYRLNTRRTMRAGFDRHGFDEESFACLDDLSAFRRFAWLRRAEFALWRACRRLGWVYPENCLLGVYRKR